MDSDGQIHRAYIVKLFNGNHAAINNRYKNPLVKIKMPHYFDSVFQYYRLG